jgi:hypothetical protein
MTVKKLHWSAYYDMPEKIPATFGNLYLGNKMSGVPFFNAAWFDETAAKLRGVPGVTSVFSPAQHDRDLGLDLTLCPTGSSEEAARFNLPAGKCLHDDLDWIYEFSRGMVAGPLWRDSSGTITEIAFHQALGLPVWEGSNFFNLFDSGYDPALLFDATLRWQLPSLKEFF